MQTVRENESDVTNEEGISYTIHVQEQVSWSAGPSTASSEHLLGGACSWCHEWYREHVKSLWLYPGDSGVPALARVWPWSQADSLKGGKGPRGKSWPLGMGKDQGKICQELWLWRASKENFPSQLGRENAPVPLKVFRHLKSWMQT